VRSVNVAAWITTVVFPYTIFQLTKVDLMATSSTKSKSKGTSKGAPPKDREATALLRADHKLVSGLFADYEKARSMSRKKTIAEKICMELSVHAQVEEEIFYPAFKLALEDTELVPEATVEHTSLKELIAQIEGIEADEEMFDARIKVLSEYVKHHVKEEQNEMFVKAKASDLDLVELGAQISSRKREIMAEKS
jgi:hemerythrin superfamily protein